MSESLERWGDVAPEWMREAASVYGQEGPSPLELDRMLTNVQRATAAPSRDAVARGALRPRLGGALVLGALAIASLALVLSRAPGAPQRVESPQTQRVPLPARAEAAVLPRPAVTDKPELESATQPRAASSAAGAAKPLLRHRGEVTAGPVDELTLLVRARRVLGRDPGRAYVLTEQHRKSYRRGALSEERELLAIEALVALGRPVAAEARAAQFAQRFPRSVHARKLGLILRGALP